MLRALFLAAGLFVLVLGLECLAIDNATLTNISDQGSGPTIVTFMPQEWVPWSLISAGAVTILYSFTLPNKFKSG